MHLQPSDVSCTPLHMWISLGTELTHGQLMRQCTRCAESLDILRQEPRAGVLRPAYVLVRDRQLKMIVLCVRGTHSLKVSPVQSV